MNRLTYFKDGYWRLDFEGVQYQAEFVDRLAAYEDSRCAPEEVLPKDKADEIALKLMRLADLENLCSYDRLRELAAAEKAGEEDDDAQ